VTFEAIERIRLAAAPAASFQSTAMACVRLTALPTALLKIEPRFSARERRAHNPAQLQLHVAPLQVAPSPQLRVAVRYINDAGTRSGIEIFKQMRIPARSVLSRVYEGFSEQEVAETEDQSWWETTKSGSLSRLPISVRGIRRGTHVYGLIAPVL